MDLIALLTEYGADESLIALAQRWVDQDQETVEALTDDELGLLLDGLVALGEDDSCGLELVRQAADCASAVREEQQAREQAAVDEEEALAAERARLRGDEPEAADVTPTEGDDETDPEEDADDVNGGDAEAVETGEPVLVAAGQTAPTPRPSRTSLARRTPRSAQPAPGAAGARPWAWRLAAGFAGHNAGYEVPDERELDRLMQERWNDFREASLPTQGAERVRVATMRYDFPDDRRLISPDGTPLAPDVAEARIRDTLAAILDATDPYRALTAAGGFCAPPIPFFGVDVLGDAYRPVRDTALVSFQTSRGGLTLFPNPTLAQIVAGGGVSVWDEDDDIAALTPPPTKPIMRVECPDPCTRKITAFPIRILFGNMLDMAWPELIRGWSDLSLVAAARVAETYLLAQIKNNSTVLDNETTTISATRDLLDLLSRLAWGYRSRSRLRETYPFRVILPEITRGLMQTDIARALPGGNFSENLGMATTILDQFFAARRLTVTWSPDLSVVGPQGATVADWPSNIEFALYPEGSFLHMDAGELNLGIVRDSSLNEVNDAETFVETFEQVSCARNQALWGSVNVCPSGAVSGTLDVAGLCATYT